MSDDVEWRRAQRQYQAANNARIHAARSRGEPVFVAATKSVDQWRRIVAVYRRLWPADELKHDQVGWARAMEKLHAAVGRILRGED